MPTDELLIGSITVAPADKHLVEGLGIALGPYSETGQCFDPCLTDAAGTRALAALDAKLFRERHQRGIFWSFADFNPAEVDPRTLNLIGST